MLAWVHWRHRSSCARGATRKNSRLAPLPSWPSQSGISRIGRAGPARLSVQPTPLACMSRPDAGPARPPQARQRPPQHRRKETGTADTVKPPACRQSYARSYARNRCARTGFRTFRNKVNTLAQHPGPLAMGRFLRKLRTQAGPSKYEKFEGFPAKPAPWSSCWTAENGAKMLLPSVSRYGSQKRPSRR